MSKTLLITGGASGIGAETARRAARAAIGVAINYRTRDAQARRPWSRHRGRRAGKAIALPGDMAREADIVRLFEDDRAVHWGPSPHLVNSAGINGQPRPDRRVRRRGDRQSFRH